MINEIINLLNSKIEIKRPTSMQIFQVALFKEIGFMKGMYTQT